MAKNLPEPPRLYKIVKGGEYHFIEPGLWDNRATDSRMRDYDPQLEGYTREGGLFQQDRATGEYREVAQ